MRDYVKENALQWDEAAQNYQQLYLDGTNSYNKKLLKFIQDDIGLSPGAKILDIGCGVGKYAVELAKLGFDVTVTDISSRMLEYARSNANSAGVSIISACADWESVSLSEPWLRSGFDLTVSTMSPAIHDEKTLLKAISVTKGTCFLTNFVEFQHITAYKICTSLGLPDVIRFQEPERECRSLYDIILNAGFKPHIQFVPYNWSDRRTCEEMTQKLLSRYQLPVSSAELSNTIQTFCDTDGLIDDTVHSLVAWIWWKTGRI